ncbi:hypothetical protein JX265_013878 [Neoarthrinium moseri]|uniref:Uncharacterized protein n=1 Tax=Neoarthrinium moseri TaxID=1658444 RepID=A0A9P9W7T7_9PEZI|nr:hypothetical protein JX265_013878 [Neoarthrinium moseri]
MSSQPSDQQHGFLIPPWFQEQPVNSENMNLASIFLGLLMSNALFAAVKAVRQTMRIWKRQKKANVYVFMIWMHWASNIVLGFINWFYMKGSIPPSFWLWFVILIIWVVQTQFIVQIIINRLSLLMMVRRNVARLKWGTAAIMSVINISVFCIWIPARMQINETYIHVNNIWDRCEKVIFLIIDLMLNASFLYMVNSRLIANGLTKYHRLFKLNIVYVIVSISLDVIFIGLMSLPNALIYLSFQSFAYMSKLHIEMNMAELIRKVVQASNPSNENRSPYNNTPRYGGKGGSSGAKAQRTFLDTITMGAAGRHNAEHHAHVELGSCDEAGQDSDQGHELAGIQRTIVTEVVHTKAADGDEVSTSSTSDLKHRENPFGS